MSRIGKQPIVIPAGVELTIDGQNVKVKGPKGELERSIHPIVKVAKEDVEGVAQVQFEIPDEEDGNQRAHWGTSRANVANMVIGVTEGFERKLEVNGVGYRVNVQGNKVVLNVGYSHPVDFVLPEGVEAKAEDNVLTLTGINKQLVGETASRMRSVRKPEPYKGKGIKYMEEVIRRKAGKAAKAGE